MCATHVQQMLMANESLLDYTVPATEQASLKNQSWPYLLPQLVTATAYSATDRQIHRYRLRWCMLRSGRQRLDVNSQVRGCVASVVPIPVVSVSITVTVSVPCTPLFFNELWCAVEVQRVLLHRAKPFQYTDASRKRRNLRVSTEYSSQPFKKQHGHR